MATSLPAGAKCHAKFSDGEFYVAEVVEWSTAKKRAKAPVKVHYLGYGADQDAWVTKEDIRSKQLEKAPKEKKEKPAKEAKNGKEAPKEEKAMPAVGDKLKAKFSDGEMYAAEVVLVSTAQKRKKAPVKVHFVGYGEEEDCWVSLDDCAPAKKKKGKKGAAKEEAPAPAPAGVPSVGTRLQALFEEEDKYYVAEIVAVEMRPFVKVHYLGYGNDEDAWLPLDKVRSKAAKAAKKAAAKAETKAETAAPEKPAGKGKKKKGKKPAAEKAEKAEAPAKDAPAPKKKARKPRKKPEKKEEAAAA